MARHQDPSSHAPRSREQDRRQLNPGCVVIGRNEGERLRRCLESIHGDCSPIVYVDSGSTDDSVQIARGVGAEVVQLDLDRPFTAARARNAGLDRLFAMSPETDLVQLVDGDCEVVAGWTDTAQQRLREDDSLALVCGRRRERYPEASIYNAICDVEWDTPIGDALYCGGDSMMRVAAVRQVGLFDPDLIAGEEPELCVRLRREGWRIERIDAEMTLHDAAIVKVSQWWKRCVRAGHAFAEGADMHGDGPDGHWRDEARRILIWGGVVPAVAFGAALPTLGASLSLLAGYPISTARNYRYTRERGRSTKDALLYSISCTVGRFAEFQGAAQYHLSRRLGRRQTIIEYRR